MTSSQRSTLLPAAVLCCAVLSLSAPAEAQVVGDECNGAIVAGLGSTPISNIGATDSLDAFVSTGCGFSGIGFMAADIWLSFTAPQDGLLTVSLCNSVDFDSDLVVYQGTCGAKTQVACSGDALGCLFTSEVVDLPVTAGSPYLIRVGGWAATETGSGTITLALATGGSEAGNCANGLDDDSDGAIDCLDDDCAAEAPCTPFLRGDCTPNGSLNIADAISLLDYLFNGAPASTCLEACDTNDSGSIDISDAIALLAFLFTAGAPPADPGPVICGPDPTADDGVPCDSYTVCP